MHPLLVDSECTGDIETFRYIQDAGSKSFDGRRMAWGSYQFSLIFPSKIELLHSVIALEMTYQEVVAYVIRITCVRDL